MLLLLTSVFPFLFGAERPQTNQSNYWATIIVCAYSITSIWPYKYFGNLINRKLLVVNNGRGKDYFSYALMGAIKCSPLLYGSTRFTALSTFRQMNDFGRQ